MKQRVKPMPLVMTVLSAVYFLYVLSSEDTILMADAVGGDPGGKLLPMVMAVFMFVGFLYITLKERSSGEGMDPETRRLFIITLVLSVLYVLLIKTVGFVILSSLLLFGLEYIYATSGEKGGQRTLLLGSLGTTAATVFLYFIMRLITRNLMSLGRAGVLPGIFAVTTFEAAISLVYVAAVAFLLHRTVCARLRGRGLGKLAGAGLLTAATVLFLYVVFKQFFSVNLAVGLLNF